MAAPSSASDIISTSPLLQVIAPEDDSDDDLIIDAHARLDFIERFLTQRFGYNPDILEPLPLPAGGRKHRKSYKTRKKRTKKKALRRTRKSTRRTKK